MSGSPDADDLKMITNGINDIEDNSNKQISINNQVYNSLDNLTETINVLTDLEENNYKIILEENQLIIITINLDIISDELKAIQESIILSKLGLINFKLLTTSEIIQIDEHLQKSGINTELLEEALNFAEVSIATNNEILLYVIKIPTFYEQIYEALRIEAIFKNSQRIRLKGNDYVRGENELFLQKTKCESLGNWTLCHRSNLEKISNDDCVNRIIQGLKSECPYEEITNHQQITEMSPTMLLLNDINDTLHTTCGITDRNLSGSFIIAFRNCSISVGRHTFKNNIIKTTHQRIFTPSTSLVVGKENLEYQINTHTLHQLQRQHLNQLEHIKSRTNSHYWSLIGNFSLSSTIIIIIVIYTLIKLQTRSAANTIDQRQDVPNENRLATTNIQFYQPPSTNPTAQR